jgi:hypothetical protein
MPGKVGGIRTEGSGRWSRDIIIDEANLVIVVAVLQPRGATRRVKFGHFCGFRISAWR